MPLDVAHRMLREVLVDFGHDLDLYFRGNPSAQVGQRFRRSGDHERRRVALAHEVSKRLRDALGETVFLKMMPVGRLDRAADARARGGEGPAGPVGPLIVGGRIVVELPQYMARLILRRFSSWTLLYG